MYSCCFCTPPWPYMKSFVNLKHMPCFILCLQGMEWKTAPFIIRSYMGNRIHTKEHLIDCSFVFTIPCLYTCNYSFTPSRKFFFLVQFQMLSKEEIKRFTCIILLYHVYFAHELHVFLLRLSHSAK